MTEVLIFASVMAGIDHITDQNYQEFFARLVATELAHGPLLVDHGEERNVTLAEVRAHIGLKTNASRLTKQQFMKQMGTALLRRGNDELRRQMEKTDD